MVSDDVSGRAPAHCGTRWTGSHWRLLGLLLPLLLSGCGGGGGGINSTSSSDQGFRIVPAGGTVTPTFSDDGTAANITINAQPNAVTEGARVDLFHHTLTPEESTALTNQVGKLLGQMAYSVVLTPRPSSFGSQVQITVASIVVPVDPTIVPQTIKIYTYDSAAKSWLVLPGTYTSSSGSVTGRMIFPTTPSDPKSRLQDAISDSSVYVVAYDVAPPAPTGI